MRRVLTRGVWDDGAGCRDGADGNVGRGAAQAEAAEAQPGAARAGRSRRRQSGAGEARQGRQGGRQLAARRRPVRRPTRPRRPSASTRARSGGTPRRRSTASRRARRATTRATSRSRSSTSPRRSTSSSSTRRAYAIFSEIADKPNHLKYNETLLWLAKLATDLPEPADIVERVGKYNDEQVAQVQQPEAAATSTGSSTTCSAATSTATASTTRRSRLFEKVDAPEQVLRPGAVLRRHLERAAPPEQVPAVQSFQRILGAIDEGDVEVEDEARMRDLAYLSMARTYYSASVKLDEQPTRRRSTQTRLSAAVKYWNKVDVASEYWLDALFEESWAYFMAGDYSHALGNIHTIEAPYFPHSYYPEADVLKAVIYFANCQYDDATHDRREVPAASTSRSATSSPRRSTSSRATNQEEAFYKFLKDVRDDKAQLDAEDRADRRRRALGPPAPPQPRVRAPPRRGGEALQEGAEQLQGLEGRRTS